MRTRSELTWERTILALPERTLNPTAPSVRRAKCLDGPGQGPVGSPAARGKTEIVRIGSFVYAVISRMPRV